MKQIAYVGIDPGVKGAYCILVPETSEVLFYKTTGKTIETIDYFKAAQVKYNIRCIMIEDVHSIFGTSARSNFIFGKNVGIVQTVANSLGERVDLVAPKKWQKALGVKTKGKAIKKEVAEICDRLYPKTSVRGPKGGLLDGLSDSLLIAHYAFLTYNQLP